MPRVIEGNLVDAGGRYALVVTRFNEMITSRLLEGALDALRRHGVDTDERVTVAWCPGSWEAPLVARKLAETGQYDAVVALACVIRGGTAHYDHICNAIASGLAHVAAETGIPVTFGVLTVDSIDQAIERAGTKMGNKGADAALAAIEMVALARGIEAAHAPVGAKAGRVG